MATNESLIVKINKRIKRNRCFRIVNKKYAGSTKEKAFIKKANALRKAGFTIGKNVRVVGPIFVTANLTIGDNVWIGKDCQFEGNGNVIIGNNCDIAPNVVFSTGGHKIGASERRAGEGMITNIEIGDGTWIGNGAILFNDIKIGKGCVIGARALVNKSFEDNVEIIGIPAKVSKNLK